MLESFQFARGEGRCLPGVEPKYGKESEEMASCHEMRLGEVYVCEECGLELKVVKECKEVGLPEEECSCAVHGGFECCGEPLKLKKKEA